MSVVVGQVTKNKILLAADSQISCGREIRDNLSFTKINIIKDIVVGTVGECQEALILNSYIKNTIVPDNICGLVGYFAEFYKYRDSLNRKIEPEGKDSLTNSQFMLVVNGTLFFVNELYVDMVVTYHAMGIGDEYAYGAMEAGANIVKAVEIACKFSTDCGLPVQYMEIKR